MLAPDRLAQSDPEVWNAIRLEYQRLGVYTYPETSGPNYVRP